MRPIVNDHLLRLRTWVLALVCIASVSCAHIVQIERTCGTGANESRCIGQMTVPREHKQLFTEGAQRAVDAIETAEFERQLAEFIAAHANDDDIRGPWSGQTARAIAAMLREELSSIEVTTFGGPKGVWYGVFSGTVAFEGNGEAIPVNRWGLKDRTTGDIANTIAHEAAHAIGLTHPSSDKKRWVQAKCEPPYVIGSIVQRIADGANWKWTDDDCARLK